MNKILRQVPADRRGNMQVVRLLTLRPSQDLGRLANEFEFRLPWAFRFLLRGLGTRETESPDVLSFLLFEPGYLKRLLEIGERDGEARMGEVEGLFEDTTDSGTRPPIELDDSNGRNERAAPEQ